MRFFVEETSFELPAQPDAEALERGLEAFIALVDACRAKNEDIFRGSGLFDVEIVPGIPLHRLLYETIVSLPIDKITLRGVQIALLRCVDWEDRVETVPNPNVEITSVACVAPSAAVARTHVASGTGAACLCLGLRPDRSGALTVRAGTEANEVHFMTQARALPIFYRSLFEVEDLDANAYVANTTHAFPDIVFANGLAGQFDRFEWIYRDARPMVTKHLSVLNDHFQRVHKEAKHKTDAAIGEYGIDASLERGTTHKNKKAMKQREVVVDGETIVCEWHTKLARHTGRIHFHPGEDGVLDGRLVVGLFAGHLEL
jgi:hypothetical protein